MRIGPAIAIGLLGGAALAWWLASPEARPQWPWGQDAPDPGQSTHGGTAAAQAVPPLYRWRDEAGVLQVTQHPPRDRPWERVDIPAERNILPAPAPPPQP